MNPVQVGRYRIEAEVARGGMGVVYRACDELGRSVALKLQLKGKNASALQRRRVETEIQTLLRLRHPNVVELLDAGEHEGVPFLVMEWVQGETLGQRLEREGPLDPRAAVELVQRLAGALSHCHAQGVLHRDLKPDNVLLREADRQPLLTDFGLSKDVLGEEVTTAVRSIAGCWLGTPGYWPPEQANGELERIGPRSDVYGLGALLYACLTGSPPQEGRTLAELIQALNRAPVPPGRRRAGLPPWLDAVCLRALAISPADRHANMDELAQDLSQGDEPSRWVRPSGPPGSADGAAPTERVAALRVGPWIVERELGRGAAGIVYQARHPELGVRAALKLLPLLDPHDLARVERETQALARLAHPGLVRLLEAGRVERGIYLALELVEGPTLHERVRREGPLPPREAARVLEALARACEHVHRAGVVHRDIKPANVLLPPGGHPRLIDFGLVRAETPGTASLTATGTLLGTPGFMSPEQIQALPVDVRSDVYGLGATLYFALTGCSPFEGTDALKVIKAQLQQAPERPGALRVGIPAALERVCLRCLERDPQRRFPSALALAQALHASAGEGPRTLRGPALAAGAILALSAVASGLVLVRGRTAPTRPAATGRVPAPAPVATEGRAAAPEPPLSEAPAPEPPAPEPPVPEPPPPDWRQEGIVAVGEGRTEDALRAFDRALEADPQDLVALTKRASLRWGQGDLQGAREDLDRALARDERDPYLWSQSSGLYLMSGDGERCEADATRAIELDPDGASAYLNRSSARSLRGDLAGALADLDAYLQRQPGPAPIYLARAQLRVQVGDLTGALADHERALALAPDDPDALWGRGALRLQRGDLPGSLADLERLRAVLPPGDPRRGQVEELLRQFGR